MFQMSWEISSNGYQLKETIIKSFDSQYKVTNSTQQQTIIYSPEKPHLQAVDSFFTNKGFIFPEKSFRNTRRTWESNISNIAFNKVGEQSLTSFFKLVSKNPLTFQSENKFGSITSTWSIDSNSIIIKQTLTAKRNGYFSVTTPSIFYSEINDIEQVVIPGYIFAKQISPDFVSAHAYGHFIPDRPVIYRDRCATTPTVILSTKHYTVSIVPEEKFVRKPHDKMRDTHENWNVGLSIMNLNSEVAPTLYYPVLGQENSFLHEGEKLEFGYRFIVTQDDWYTAYKQTIYNVFKFDEQKNIYNRQSLTSRIYQIYRYLTNPTTSRFRVVDNGKGLLIGAHDYLGSVLGKSDDAMKNSDYGAMWMLANLTRDSILLNNIIPYARNFKLDQIYSDKESKMLKGAVKGQYFLWKSKKWVEEWGEYIEPIGITYYALADIGNMLLFQPDDTELLSRFKLAAEYLLSLQKKDGSWEVGYNINDMTIIYPDLKDYRPTFYGMLIAHEILKDKKYLEAAIKGADWFVKEAVEKGRFIGVCGDARFSPDFGTAQSVQALLDMYNITGNLKYKNAAIKTAKIYTTYIYTYPNGQYSLMTHSKQTLPGWAFSQSGLCFEHAGTIGSSNTRGPIMLSSFAGMFVRMFKLTGDSLYIDMARASANGKDAYVDDKTGVVSYYWDTFNTGAGPYPHHAWWQIGWILDYLVSEAELRSKGGITFPRGFITPKVGPHQCLGFKHGIINGEKVQLIMNPKIVKCNHPMCEYLIFLSEYNLYVIAMNSCSNTIITDLDVDFKNKVNECFTKEFKNIMIEPYGLKILKLNISNASKSE